MLFDITCQKSVGLLELIYHGFLRVKFGLCNCQLSFLDPQVRFQLFILRLSFDYLVSQLGSFTSGLSLFLGQLLDVGVVCLTYSFEIVYISQIKAVIGLIFCLTVHNLLKSIKLS